MTLTEQERKAVEEVLKSLVDVAADEGRLFELKHGRKPTEAEAGEIAGTVLRQARIALVMARR